MATLTVASGDCISSISSQAGLLPDTVWSQNSDLAKSRDNPNVLNPGDRVIVPDPNPKNFDRNTDRRHPFRLTADPTLLRVQILRVDLTARANLDYTLTIDGTRTLSGKTDGDGKLEQQISPTAKEVTIAFNENDNPESYRLPLGAIMPVDVVKGTQQRLLNLGFDCGPVDGQWGRHSTAAMREYQELRGLNQTGRRDDASRADLKSTHGC
jgi:hypothetical protein